MQELKLTSPIPPSVNHYLAYRSVIRGGKALSVSYCTKEAKKYKSMFAKYVAEEAERQKWDVDVNSTQHFYVDAVFYFPRIDMDANNYFKVMLDAITDADVIWKDDNVVCERVQGIYYDTENPRIEITIHPVSYIGIFKDMSHKDEFVSLCVGCGRYKRNCSLLKNAIAGKVQNEIKDGVCSERKPTDNRRKKNGKEK